MTIFTARRGVALRRFVRHYLEMIAAMIAGMIVLGPLESLLLNPIGWAELRAQPEVNALVMATNMTIPMAVRMRFRRHGRARTVEMAGAMYMPFVALFPLTWLGVLSSTGLIAIGHVLMLFAMAAVMLWRRDEYAGNED